MSAQQHQFIQILIETGDKLSLEDFFKSVHRKFYSDYDISFMEYFLELTTREGEFVVHHEKLIEYGVMTSGRSSAVKTKLDALELVENIDYSLPNDVRAVGRCARNKTHQSIHVDTRSIQKLSYESKTISKSKSRSKSVF